MVREYVERLYSPVAGYARALDGRSGHEGADELARWKTRVRQAWPAVRVDHVEADGVADVVKVGDRISMTAYVSLGDLRPEDVEVQAVAGRPDEADNLRDLVRRAAGAGGGATRAAGTRSGASARSTRRGRSATRCASCRATPG